MVRLLLWLVGSAVLSACATVPAPRDPVGPAQGAQFAIVGVTVIPMTSASATLTDHTILIRDGRIFAMGPRRAVAVPPNARVVDGKGRYLMPGLADAHVHLEHIEDPDILKLFLANGVTTVRSMDGRPFILDWRERVGSGSLVGPRIVTAGPIIDGSPPARDDNLAVADAASARAAVIEQMVRGYDFIKAYSNLSPESYEAILSEAKDQALQVAGHVPRGVKLERAMQSLWSLEHLGDFAGSLAAQGGPLVPGWARRSLAAPLDQARLRTLAKQLADAGVWVVPTAVQQDRWLAPAAQVEMWLADPQMRNVGPQAIEQWRGAAKWSARMDADDWKLVDQARRNRLATISAFHRRSAASDRVRHAQSVRGSRCLRPSRARQFRGGGAVAGRDARGCNDLDGAHAWAGKGTGKR